MNNKQGILFFRTLDINDYSILVDDLEQIFTSLGGEKKENNIFKMLSNNDYPQLSLEEEIESGKKLLNILIKVSDSSTITIQLSEPNIFGYYVIFSKKGGIISVPQIIDSNSCLSIRQNYIFFTQAAVKNTTLEYPSIIFDSGKDWLNDSKYGGVSLVANNKDNLFKSFIYFPSYYSSEWMPSDETTTKQQLQRNNVPIITNVIIPQISNYYFPFMYKKQSPRFFFYGLYSINNKIFFLGDSFGMQIEDDTQ